MQPRGEWGAVKDSTGEGHGQVPFQKEPETLGCLIGEGKGEMEGRKEGG